MVTVAERQSLTKKPFSSLLHLEASSKLNSMATTPTAGFVLIVYMPIAHMTSILHLMDQTQSVVGGLGGAYLSGTVLKSEGHGFDPWQEQWEYLLCRLLFKQQHVKVGSKALVIVPKVQCGKF